jgi:L-lactate utilization protein LutB
LKKETKVPRRRRSKKAVKVIKLETVVNENIKNSLKLLKEWNDRRKVSKTTKESNMKEIEKMKESFRENVNAAFETLYKFKDRYHVITVKSPIDAKAYRFMFKLKNY